MATELFSFSGWPWWAKLLGGAVVLYAGYLVLVAIAQAASVVAEQIYIWAQDFVHWLSETISRGVLSAFKGIGRGLLFLLKALAWPIVLLWDRVCAAAAGVVDRMTGRLQQDQELRRLWKEEYRDQYKTFREFKEAFNNHGQETAGDGERGDGERREPGFSDPGRSDDPFIEACRLLELPEDGDFSEVDLKRRHGRLVSALHPDKGGSNVLMMQINVARDLIKARRGWV